MINTPTQAAVNSLNHSVHGSSLKWRFQPGTYTAKHVVEHVAPLLNSLIAQLGHDPPGAVSSRTILIDGLRSCLATTGRESSLPIGDAVAMTGESSRQEMASQAQQIGSLLVRCAQNASSSNTTSLQISVRSPCEGHVWTRDVAGLLIGPRSNGNLMQVYNEWLHQIVLLRDGLLPFENFDEVQLDIKREGTRPLEDIRSKFLMQIITAQVKRTTLVDVAKVLTASDLPTGGYGFQYAKGIVMPTSLFTGGSSTLLRYVPAIVDDSQHHELLFDYQHKDYFAVLREEIKAPGELIPSDSSVFPMKPSPSPSELASSSLAIETPGEASTSSQVRYIKLHGIFENGVKFSVDIGQITRGLRYAYRIVSADTCSDNGSVHSGAFGWHKASDILSLPNLVTAASHSDSVKLHVIQAGSALVRLALLGKLYPENVVIQNGGKQPLIHVLGVGKGFGPQFVIVGGELGQS